MVKTYLSEFFDHPFSDAQKEFLSMSWNTILNKGIKNINAYRGFGKTTIFSGLLLMSHSMGLTRHALYVTAEGTNKTKEACDFFQAALYEDFDKTVEESKPFCQDYPEICYPLKRREGVAQRPLLHNGSPCNIKISPEKR